ncbi:proline-serine-threonine phosphatase-interacting protein 2 isoform X2 [Rhinoderma darwinii]|uniref:proline-serine-threonine phosphatase-interacting protein 2 isoform X2 n=1 Tax=Rhinoderma darwinii TaxID=43563 RepID=UPI003F681DC5
MRGVFFKENFWSTDITSTLGYDTLLQHMNDGRKNCKEFEDFIRERAVIEERYGKDLVNLTKKKPCGQTEMNTLKRSLDVFKQQIDNIGQCHIQLAQALREEAKKMEEFRERQKAERKKIEAAMDGIHKQRQLQYKRTVDSKKTYEQRCREKDEAEMNVSRCNKNMNQKQQDKIYAKLAHSKVTAEDADKTYQQNVSLLDKVREDWQKEHIMACVVCEEVRRALEGCNIEKDIEHFTDGHKIGDKPPAPIPYENFYNTQRNATPVIRRGPLQTPTSVPDDPAYATVGDFNVYQ